jgi:hypothetical protein
MFSAVTRITGLVVVAGICLATQTGAYAQQSPGRPALAIRAIRAMPYYPSTGELRRTTDLFDPRLVLRNIIFGAPTGEDPLHRPKIEDWDIKFGTTVTYVEIDVEADPGPLIRDGRVIFVELEAKVPNTKRVVSLQRVRLNSLVVAEGKLWRVPFFVYGTGCEKLELNARVVSGTTAYAKETRAIPFSCGE